ncbi:uncharacterized protein LOC131316715 [Rhododendron vialii]|uniref:uncharacterized protein LOC131316715 n=1 Tax=Rhododendron vialii TaxID=182163 RepID=UPI00265F7B2C|nr:uncharacterized protein LOC131316715 [Rhododendron vialii]XP_058202131.1 uncharacterized protein LOC131316715 [Rhododendron vialii]
MENDELAQQVKDIKAALAHSKGDQIHDFDGLCLFPNAKLPEKFNMPDTEKFNGTGNPTRHVCHIINTLKPLGLNDELIAQLFQRTLTGNALDWFLTLDFTKYKGWQEIANAFINQYAYNVQIEVTTRDLEMLKQKPNESFANFLTRWRKKAAQMKTLRSEEDQIRMVVRNLLPQFLRHMYSQAISTFKCLYATGLQVEDGLNQGLLDNGEVSHKVETSTNTNNDSGINMVISHHKRKREFVPLRMKLEDVFHILEATGDLKPLQPKFPSNLA